MGNKNMVKYYDKIIFGAGLYGLYSALKCAEAGQSILVLERDSAPFKRATYINQARVHMGYHYPRSFSTAIKSAHYFERFCNDYDFCIHKKFSQVYATSSHFSWTDAEEFKQFCANANIMCKSIDPDWYFKRGMCDGAFLTEEYTYDAQILKEWFMKKLNKNPSVQIEYNHKPEIIKKFDNTCWKVTAQDIIAETPFILNATYASVNDILSIVDNIGGAELFKIKFEKCEIILCTVNEKLKDIGITVMDGPFFSLMPFGKTGLHSLTSVTFTPHETSYDPVAAFSCQDNSNANCAPGNLYNCNDCIAKPETAWPYMSQLAKKYLKEEFEFSYHSSLFSMKPILKASEIDDSRPTVIKKFSDFPTFISVLSGKINTVYDLDEVLLSNG